MYIDHVNVFSHSRKAWHLSIMAVGMVVGIVFGIVGQITEVVMIDDGTVLTTVCGNVLGTSLLVIITYEVIPGIGIIYVGLRLVTAVNGTITGETIVGGMIMVGGNVVHDVNDVGSVQVYHGVIVYGGGVGPTKFVGRIS